MKITSSPNYQYVSLAKEKVSFTSLIQAPSTRKESYEFTRIMASELGFSKFKAKLLGFIEGFLGNKNSNRIIKDDEGKIFGGYSFDLQFRHNGTELNIRSLSLLKQNNNRIKTFKLICNDIKKVAQKNSADKITLDVQKEKSGLIAMYKKLGFEIEDNRNIFMYKMSVSYKDFCKNFKLD